MATTNVTVDLEKHPELAAELLAAKGGKATGIAGTLNEVVDSIDVKKMEVWGVSAAAGIKAICSQLSISVNEFIKTDVGKLTALAIYWKIAGDDTAALIDTMWHIFLGCFGYAFMMIMLLWHYRSKHGVKKFKDEDTKKYYFVPRYEWPEERNINSTDWRWETWSQFWHVLIFFVITAICLLIVY